MPLVKIHRVQGIEDSNIQLMARLKGTDGANVTQSDLSGIAFEVYNTRTVTLITSGTLTIANVIFDTLQTDARWTADATGYNFLHDVPLAALPDGNETYRFEYLFTPAVGLAYYGLYEVSTIALFGS